MTEMPTEPALVGQTLGQVAAVVPDCRVIGDPATRVFGVTHDSRQVEAGDMFACLVGDSADGHRFVGDALGRGAAALLIAAMRRDELPVGVPALVVRDTREALAPASACVFGRPSEHMDVIGVTGTNGKTTTCRMIAEIAAAAGQPSGTIGTLGAEAMGRSFASEHTTPEASDLQRLLAQMRAAGTRVVAMEASSHGLAQRRTDATRFAAAVFTNLTQDHLDYHRTLDDYFAAKLRLFAEYPKAFEGPFVAAVNADDPRGDLVARATAGRVITFGLGARADVRATGIRADATALAFRVEGRGDAFDVSLPVGGLFQVHNALAAIAVCGALGMPTEAIVGGLSGMRPVPGRFEAIETGRGWHLIVDFAHTPDGLSNLITSARQLAPRRLIVVMGCGGNRDRTKRPIMGRICGESADLVLVTSDNPRHEDPAAIIGEIVGGLEGLSAKVIVEPDRRQAIARAIAEARSGDIVLLAGKGAETQQIVGNELLPFDDRQVAREELERPQ